MMINKFLAGILVSLTSVQSFSAFATTPSQIKDLSVSSLKQQEVLNSPLEYVPPVDRNPQRTQGTGSRGCGELLPATHVRELITLFIPSKDYAGQTISGHPTFVWYFSETIPLPVEFLLIEEDSGEEVFYERFPTDLSGLVSLEMPKDLPPLKPDTSYQWSVTLFCQDEPIVYYITGIERVEMSSTLAQQLEAIEDTTDALSWQSSPQRQQAIVYAKAGLWYDALELLMAAQNDYPNDFLVKQDLSGLLKQVGLMEEIESMGVNRQER